jgi:hypothetical protein
MTAALPRSEFRERLMATALAAMRKWEAGAIPCPVVNVFSVDGAGEDILAEVKALLPEVMFNVRMMPAMREPRLRNVYAVMRDSDGEIDSLMGTRKSAERRIVELSSTVGGVWRLKLMIVKP